MTEKTQNSTEKIAEEPGSESKLKSIARETKGLINDLKDWVDLRVKLLQIEVEERIEAAASKIISLLLVAVLGVFAGLMFLIAIAEALSLWLGHPSFGYIIVGVVMAGLAFLLNRSRPRFGRGEEQKSIQTEPVAQLSEVAGKENETPKQIDPNQMNHA